MSAAIRPTTRRINLVDSETGEVLATATTFEIKRQLDSYIQIVVTGNMLLGAQQTINEMLFGKQPTEATK